MILGIDPGLVETGLVCLDGKRVHYSAGIKTPSDWTDERRREVICADVLKAWTALGGPPIWIEDYEYQGPRTATANALRMPALVFELVGYLKARGATVRLVSRTTWGRALGAMTDAGRARRLSALTGLTLTNEHRRDAAMVARYGQSVARDVTT